MTVGCSDHAPDRDARGAGDLPGASRGGLVPRSATTVESDLPYGAYFCVVSISPGFAQW